MSRFKELCQILNINANLSGYSSDSGFYDASGSTDIGEDIYDKFVNEMNEFYENIDRLSVNPRDKFQIDFLYLKMDIYYYIETRDIT